MLCTQPDMPDVRRLVSSKRGEPMTLHSIMQGIRANEFEWLCVEQPHRAPASEAKKRQELASQFIHWLFDQHLIPLLQVSCV